MHDEEEAPLCEGGCRGSDIAGPCACLVQVKYGLRVVVQERGESESISPRRKIRMPGESSIP